jgi:putative transcriptional regulator
MINLKPIRIAKKLTQKEVAKIVGISTSFYNEIENGKRRPAVAKAKKIAKVLEIDWVLLIEL